MSNLTIIHFIFGMPSSPCTAPPFFIGEALQQIRRKQLRASQGSHVHGKKCVECVECGKLHLPKPIRTLEVPNHQGNPRIHRLKGMLRNHRNFTFANWHVFKIPFRLEEWLPIIFESYIHIISTCLDLFVRVL